MFMKKLILMSILFFLFSCKSHHNESYTHYVSSYYQDCINNYAYENGENLYSELSIIEGKLLNSGILNGTSSSDYEKMFKMLFQSDTLRNTFELLQPFINYNLYNFYYNCSKFDTVDNQFIPLDVYKKILFNMRYNYDDDTLIDLLFCSTDFSDKIMRMNVLIVFLTNLEVKYGGNPK